MKIMVNFIRLSRCVMFFSFFSIYSMEKSLDLDPHQKEVTKAILGFLAFEEKDLDYIGENSWKCWKGRVLNSDKQMVVHSERIKSDLSIEASMQEGYTHPKYDNQVVKINTVLSGVSALESELNKKNELNKEQFSSPIFLLLEAYKKNIHEKKSEYLDSFTTFEQDKDIINFTTHYPFRDYNALINKPKK